MQFGGRIPIGKKGESVDLSLSSTEQVAVPQMGEVVCEFHDRERLWNILFDIDLVLWIVSWFVQMPPLYSMRVLVRLPSWKGLLTLAEGWRLHQCGTYPNMDLAHQVLQGIRP